MNIKQNVTEIIGHTPIMRLGKYMEKSGIEDACIYAKLEFLNPGGSTKDRAALSMLEEAEKKGVITKGATIIESTSGNTGIGLALVAAAKGYRVIITLPESMSIERRKMLKAYGAELVLTDEVLGMAGAVEKAEELHKEIPGSMILGQFVNPDNALAHYTTTGPEIYEDMDGKVDVFIATVGTGGTITGIGRYLKEKNPNIHIVCVEPAASPLLSKGVAGPHKIQGIGANFVPEILDKNIYDEIITVEDNDAFTEGRLLGTSEGVLCGISSGAALMAAKEIAQRAEYAGKNIVVLLPDSGDRYMSTPLYSE